MASAKLPQNILNGLPLQDADAAAAGGDIQVIGGNISRFFSATALGIAGANAATIGGKVCLVSSWLDVRGCSKFIFQLRRTTPAGPVAALTAALLQIQSRMGPLDSPSPSYTVAGSLRDDFNGCNNVSGNTYTFPLTAAAGETQTAAWGWYAGSATAGGMITNAVMIGSDVRLIVSWSTNPVAATNFFTATLAASS